LHRRSIRQNIPVEAELTFKNTSHDQVWIKVTVVSGPESSFFCYEDITKHKKNIEQLMKDERLSTIGILAGGLAHQYNNLHHAVLASLYQASQTEHLDSIRDKIKEASLMLERGSTLSQSLLGHLRESDEDLYTSSVNDVFQRVEMLVKDELLKSNCSLDVDRSELLIKCKATALDQVMVNLIINSSHACHSKKEEGHIKISAFLDEDKKNVCIRVLDNGIGIKEANLSKLFTPLFSTKGVYATKGSSQSELKGTGLGLSLARQLIEKQGGSLSLEKTSQEGTSFLIKLPSAKDKNSLDSRQHSTRLAREITQKRIYIADDSKENRIILKVYLKDHIKEVCESKNGKVNKEQLLALDPDILFVDWLMPKYSGNDFLEALNKDPDLCHLLGRVIILSGLDLSAEIDSWKNKVYSVLQKPIPQIELVKIVEGIIK